MTFASGSARLPGPVKRPVLILLAGGMLAGCSPDSYRRSADRQVYEMLRQRQDASLGYTPPSQLPQTPATRPAASAFNRIPLTPLPPAVPPIEPERPAVQWGPLGPATRPALPPLETSIASPEQYELPRRDFVLGPPAPKPQPLRLDLFGALEYGASHSREYLGRMEDLYLAALDVTLQRHLFDPRAFAQTTVGYSGGQADVDYRTALNLTQSIGVRQRLPYGGEVTARALVDFVRALRGGVDDADRAAVALSGTIPLLRGAGWVNLESLLRSERELVYAVRAFESYRRDFAVDLANQYFRLLAQAANVNNRRLNAANLAALVERTTAMFQAEKISFLEVQRSQQARLQAENQLVAAEEAYSQALDSFKLRLGMAVDQPLEIVPVSLELEPPQIGLEEAVRLAHRYRLEMATAADRLEDAQRNVGVARNLLLPGLDLSGQVEAGNEDGALLKLDEDSATYSAKATLDLPLDRVAERNQYRRALIELQRAQRSQQQVRDRITAEVRDTLRAIRTAQVSIEIQRKQIELAERRLELSNELMRQGKTNARDVVESQQALLDAQDRYESARSTLVSRILEYLNVTGTLRLDPAAGAIGRAMDGRTAQDPARAAP